MRYNYNSNFSPLCNTTPPHQFFPVFRVLEVLLVPGLEAVVPLQPGLDGPVLLVEIVHVRHQVLDDVHVGQRVHLGGLAQISVNFAAREKYK